MNTKRNDGGSAFPIPLDDRPGAYQAEPGMTLRDYFAATAMGSMCSETWPDSNDRREIAKRSWAMADEMLKARQS